MPATYGGKLNDGSGNAFDAFRKSGRSKHRKHGRSKHRKSKR